MRGLHGYRPTSTPHATRRRLFARLIRARTQGQRQVETGAGIADEESQRSLWLRQLYAGLAAYFGVGLALCLYVASTWSSAPNRDAILLVTLIGLAPSPVILRYRKAIVNGRFREPFFMAWNAACYVMILVMTTLDGGIASPIALLWFFPTIYLLFGYALRAILFCGAFGVATYLLSASLSPAPVPYSLFALQLILIGDGLMLVWLGAHSRDQREQRVASLRKQLAALASTDALTGCLNQHAFGRAIAGAFESAVAPSDVALLAFDVDHFKQINDRHGHVVGDDVLRQLGACLRGLIRHGDVAGRLGGDEFAVLCPHTGVNDAIRLAERLRTGVAKLPVGVTLTLSVGICSLHTTAGDAETLRRRADRALYAAKRQGRNRSVLFAVSDNTDWAPETAT